MKRIKSSKNTTVQYIPEYWSFIKDDWGDCDPWTCSDGSCGSKSMTLKQAKASLERYASKYPVRECGVETRIRIVTTTVEIFPGLTNKKKAAKHGK